MMMITYGDVNVADYIYNNGLSFCLILLYLKEK